MRCYNSSARRRPFLLFQFSVAFSCCAVGSCSTKTRQISTAQRGQSAQFRHLRQPHRQNFVDCYAAMRRSSMSMTCLGGRPRSVHRWNSSSSAFCSSWVCRPPLGWDGEPFPVGSPTLLWCGPLAAGWRNGGNPGLYLRVLFHRLGKSVSRLSSQALFLTSTANRTVGKFFNR
jgi:hypothetical protein